MPQKQIEVGTALRRLAIAQKERPEERVKTGEQSVRRLGAAIGAHPDGMRFRPPSTAKYPSDNKGHWAVFWELDQLRQLAPHERIATGIFIGHGTGKQYKKNFIPEGPLIVIRPV